MAFVTMQKAEDGADVVVNSKAVAYCENIGVQNGRYVATFFMGPAAVTVLVDQAMAGAAVTPAEKLARWLDSLG